MKKTVIMICAAAILALVLVGCSNGTASSSTASSSASASSASASASSGGVLTSVKWPDNKTGVLPEFKTANGMLTQISQNEGAFGAEYHGITEDEVAQYVETAKSLGYTEDPKETNSTTGYNYSARMVNDNSAWIQFTYVADGDDTAFTIMEFAPSR